MEAQENDGQNRIYRDIDRLHIWYKVDEVWTYYGWTVGGVEVAGETAKAHASGRDFRITQSNCLSEMEHGWPNVEKVSEMTTIDDKIGKANAERALDSEVDLTFMYEIISHVGEPPIKNSTTWRERDGVNNGWPVDYLQDYEDRPEKEVHALLDENVTDYLYRGLMAGEFSYPEENPYYTIKWRLQFREDAVQWYSDEDTWHEGDPEEEESADGDSE